MKKARGIARAFWHHSAASGFSGASAFGFSALGLRGAAGRFGLGAASAVSNSGAWLGGVSITHGLLPTGQRLCAALPGDAPLREGEELRLGIAPADVHVFDASGAVMRRTQAPALAA